LKNEDLETVGKWVEEGKVKSVIGRTMKMSDLEAVKECAEMVYAAKGGVGKFIIEVEESKKAI